MENKDKSWFKVRGYPHITSKNKLEDKNKITKLVSNPNWVAKYAFFPLLHKIIPQRRYKIIGYDSNNKAIRSHKDGKKRTRKMRPIHYATHLDSHIYGYYSNEIIQKKYEEYLNQRPKLSDCITAYRKTNGKNNINFAKEVFDFIRNKGECCALAFDIESFFNHLNHKKLKQVWAKLIGEKALPADHYNVFKSITNFSYILVDDLKIRSYAKGQPHFDEQKLAKLRSKGIFAFFESAQEFREKVKNGEIPIYKNTWKDESGNNRGIVQGLPISAMLANLYLLEFDELMQQEIEEKQGGLYRRYSDDIVVVCDTKDKEQISNLVTESIKQFKLIISKGKTEECFFRKDKKTNKLGVSKIVNGIEKANQPLRYLGFEFYGDKTLIKSANVSKFYRRMKKAIKTKVRRAKTMSERNLSNEIVIFKRKLLRIYTDKGKRPRDLPAKRVRYRFDNAIQRFVHFVSPKAGTRKYRGNFLNYVGRAARAMEEPAIEKQLQRHKQIFRKYLKLRIEKTFDVGNNWSKEETLEKW